jgi:hypothetical protein
MNLNNPIPSEWTQYVTQSPIGLEVIPSVIYDTATYTDNVTQTLTFFNAVRATADLGNLQQPGMLPNPQSFLIQAPRLFFKYTNALGATTAAQAWNDIILLCNTGIMRLQIGEKRYGPWPLWMLSAGSSPVINMGLAGTAGAVNIDGYGQVMGNMYGMYPNLMIAPLQNFFVTLEWPAAAVDLSGNVVIQVLFDGQLARAIQ